MRKILCYLAGLVMVLCAAPAARAQVVGIKTNLVNDALLSPNLGVEFGLADHWTLQMEGEWNNWGIKDDDSHSGLKHTWKHWYASLEPRYWFCHKFAGHFMSINVIGGRYNFGHLGNGGKWLNNDFRDLNTHRYAGYGAGAGINYGYAWPVAKHWNIEVELGIGWFWTRYDKYKLGMNGLPEEKVEHHRIHNYVGPSKLAVSVEYLF